MQSLSHTA